MHRRQRGRGPSAGRDTRVRDRCSLRIKGLAALASPLIFQLPAPDSRLAPLSSARVMNVARIECAEKPRCGPISLVRLLSGSGGGRRSSRWKGTARRLGLTGVGEGHDI